MSVHKAHPPTGTVVGAGEDLRVVSGNPTPEELAAVVSVLQEMAVELDGAHAKLPRQQSAWAASQRPIRSALVPGHSRWRSFG